MKSNHTFMIHFNLHSHWSQMDMHILMKILALVVVLHSTSVFANDKNKPKDKNATQQTNLPLTKPQDCESIPAENKQQKDLCITERKLAKLKEEQRLKVLFVDVNTLMEKVGASMDWTANWIDGQFANSNSGLNKAKAWGHVQTGWEPREGEWLNFPIKFKVRARLPNLENKAELIFSDNEQEDLNRLPYETVRPDALKSSERSLGAAVRFMHSTSENLKTSSRLGWGDGQLYARSSLLFNKKWVEDKLTISLQPSLEYYVADGVGGRILADAGYAMSPKSEIKLSYMYQDREDFAEPIWRNGLYSISSISDKSALIFGITAAGVVEPKYRPEFYKISVRIRRKAIRSWIFIEAEPFVEFKRNRLLENYQSGHQYSEFERDIGIALRLEAHYGFL
jgi:hypothetical protein